MYLFNVYFSAVAAQLADESNIVSDDETHELRSVNFPPGSRF